MALTVISGPMFSGKTEALLHVARSAEQLGKAVVVLKPKLDSRYPSELVSHAGARRAAIEFSDAQALVAASIEADVIAIDEVQFVDENSVAAILDLASRKETFVAGLDRDYRAEPFARVRELSASADESLRLTSICTRCGRVATLTQRIVHGRPASLTEPTVLIGGDDIYQPRCESCYRAERTLE